MELKTIFVRCTNHFDIVWRRGFKKAFKYAGEKYVSYDKIQEACIDEWLALSEAPEFKFDIECSLVLRIYLEAHPDKTHRFRDLLREGRFELLGSGELIPDTNMPSGETLVRNLVYGFLWAERTLGEVPTTGYLNDSFGSSAQMPQIFRKCGIKWVTALCYKYASGDYWAGLDGSVVYVGQDFKTRYMKLLADETIYYPPCRRCKGDGCDECDRKGFRPYPRMDGPISPDGPFTRNAPFGVIQAGTEEALVTRDLVIKVREANENQESYEYRFMLLNDLAHRYYAHDIGSVDSPPPDRVSPELEGNPTSSGCLVSRIKTKQRVKELENYATAVEKLASIAYLNGGAYPYTDLTKAWRGIIFSCFHDSITGTHVDVGYEELEECYLESKRLLDLARSVVEARSTRRDDARLTVFNPHSFTVTEAAVIRLPRGDGEPEIIDEHRRTRAPTYEVTRHEDAVEVCFLVEDIAGLEFKEYAVRWAPRRNNPVPSHEDKRPAIENEYYVVEADEHGIVRIFDKVAESELVDWNRGYANEIILEHDVGDPWATREVVRPRVRLGLNTSLDRIERYEHHSEIVYRGEFRGNEDIVDPVDYRVLVLRWEQRVVLRKGIKRVDFRTRIEWDTFDRRIRVSFPTNCRNQHDRGFYGVPYGTVERARYEMSSTAWNNANGDWPAVGWASTGDAAGAGVAILNKGTPSYRIERGEILVSLLRSPTFPNCLLSPSQYDAPVYDGMRDQGTHRFEYALYSFTAPWNESDVVKEAERFNIPLVCMGGALKRRLRSLELRAEGTLISSLKRAEDGKGLIVRLVETRGKAEIVDVVLPHDVREVYRTDLLERNERRMEADDRGRVRVAMRPFGIDTLRLDLQRR